jgi:IrrE N-terminal-like domain
MSNGTAHQADVVAVLRSLWDVKCSQLGRLLKPEEFYPIDLPAAVEIVLSGWRVIELENLEQRAVSDFNNRIIYLDKNDHRVGQKTYSLAHEMGHALMHRYVVKCGAGVDGGPSLHRPKKAVGSGSYRRAVANPTSRDAYWIEVEADVFARELLMPEKAVRRQFEELFECSHLPLSSARTKMLLGGGGLSKRQAAAVAVTYDRSATRRPLMSFFSTSSTATAIRLEELKLITEL